MSEYSVFIQDDACHWYLIPEDKIKEFNEWVEYHTSTLDIQYYGLDFYNYRCNDPAMYRIKHLESRRWVKK